MKKFRSFYNKYIKKVRPIIDDITIVISVDENTSVEDEINNFININLNTKYSLLDFLLDTNNVNINQRYVEYCKKMHCYENIEFIYSCNGLHDITDVNILYEKCETIYKEFILPNSERQINLNHITVSEITHILNNEESDIIKLKNIYNKPLEEIKYILYGNTIVKFVESNKYYQLSDFIIETTSERRRLNSVSSIDKSKSSTSLTTDSSYIRSKNTSFSNNETILKNSNSNNKLSSEYDDF